MDKAEISSAACCPRICSGVDSTLSRESTYKDFCCSDGEACFFSFFEPQRSTGEALTHHSVFAAHFQRPRGAGLFHLWCGFISVLVVSQGFTTDDNFPSTYYCVSLSWWVKHIKKLSPESLIRPQPLNWSLTKWNMTKRRGKISRQTLLIYRFTGVFLWFRSREYQKLTDFLIRSH